MPKVNYIRTEVADLMPRWEMIRDCIAGQSQIKKRGVKYLPHPLMRGPRNELSPEVLAAYDAYKERAIFWNATGRTLRGLVGLAFGEDPVIALPPLLESLEVDADGGGVSLVQQAHEALSLCLAHGRGGLFVDYPKTEGLVVTRQDLLEGRVRPTVGCYQPWDIINWRTRCVGAEEMLSLVVLSEFFVTDDDGFEEEVCEQWRVLRLDETGNYTVEVWRRKKGSDEDECECVQPATTVLDSSGVPLRRIPFFFFGAENNSPTPDLPPLEDIAVLNLGHYRNSADYEQNLFQVGQAMPWFAGVTEDWVKRVWKGRIIFGSGQSVPLPAGGSAGILQASPNTMPKEGMTHKEEQMVMLGAKLIQSGATRQITATERVLDAKVENSVLTNCAQNVSAAYTKALQFAAVFQNANPEEVSFEISTEFELEKLTAQEREVLIKEVLSETITTTEHRNVLRRHGIATLDDEEYRAELGLPATA